MCGYNRLVVREVTRTSEEAGKGRASKAKEATGDGRTDARTYMCIVSPKMPVWSMVAVCCRRRGWPEGEKAKEEAFVCRRPSPSRLLVFF